MEPNKAQNASDAVRALTQDAEFLLDKIIGHLPQLTVGFCVLVLLVLIAKPLANIFIKPLKYSGASTLIIVVTRRIVSLLIVLLGVYTFLQLAGLGSFAVAVLSGTGIVGLIIGFAFKDIAENFMSSLLLSVQKPFRLGELIEVDGHLGIVKQVTARATTLVDFDGNHIQIPNATVYKNTIKNFTANPNARAQFFIGIGYDNDPSEAQDLAMDLLVEMPSILEEPKPQVLIENLGASSYNLSVFLWVDTTSYSLLKVRSLAMKKMTLAFLDAGISMPDDARERFVMQADQTNVSREVERDNLVSKQNVGVESKALLKPANFDDEDLSSDTDVIHEQAAKSHNPEQGENVI
jgi:small-conductance mechanosensitive channel